MRYYRIAILIFLFSAIQAKSQSGKIDDERIFDRSLLKEKKVKLSGKDLPTFDFPELEKIGVIDARPDTFGIGFSSRLSDKKSYVFQFRNGLAPEFESFFSSITNFHERTSGYSIEMVVADFWLSEIEVDRYGNDDKLIDETTYGSVKHKSTLRAKFDFYLKKDDQFIAAYRFDTTASSLMNAQEFAEKYLSVVLYNSLDKIRSIKPDAYVANKRKFSADEVKKHYDDRWNKPILKTDTLSSGVYRSFSEFINNRPSIRGYSIQKTKLADVLYSSGDGGEAIPLRDVWGYCDGQRIFIKSGENFFMLVKKQNSFYFLGSRELTKAAPLNENQSTIQRPFPYVDRYAGPEMQAFGNDHYLTNRLEPLKVDMEKGSVY